MRRTLLLGALVLPILAGGSAAAQPAGGWLVYGNDLGRSSVTNVSLSPSSVRPAWYTPVSGRISSQALVAQDVPAPGRRTVYFATSKGVVYAMSENGYVRWRVELGQFVRICPQIDGYGVTGTPAIDPATHAIYVADAFGRLHALDLTTGAELAGWPVRVYADFPQELVWGALTIVNGSVYFGTGSYCDRPMEGKVFRVVIATRTVSSWISVPRRLGGGGGVWGWGGVAYSAARGSLFVATGNAFRGGTNTGRRFRESAGFGEHIVELGPNLSVRAASHPRSLRALRDLDFVGSPVLFRHRICGELAGVLNKNGVLYVWRSAKINAGPLFSLRLARPTLAAPLLSQPAYSPRTGALYVSTPSRLVRIDVDRRCRGRVRWSRPVGIGLFNGSPTIAGDTVWLVENGINGSALLGFRARTGASRFRARLAGTAYVAPTVVGDRLYLGTYTGGVQGFALASGLRRPVGNGESDLPEHRSFPDPLEGWASREDGVYATDDGGHSWRLIYSRNAVRVARVSALTGMISLGDRVSACGCRQVRLWTADGGDTWHQTLEGVGNGFVGGAGTLWWWRGGNLYRAVRWPPPAAGLRRHLVVSRPGAIIDAAPVPGGVAALMTRRVAGLGLDVSPRVLLVQSGRVRVLRLPRVTGDVLARSLEVLWPSLTVHAFDVTAFTRGEQGPVTWTSPDGGATWTVTRE
ncbi:MAG TPA: PQQ-binding-like beta-propeller repeat protein [Gaiellaceae bacterium]|nr:PQQ-binding-like beta-propeller repeat protein [Gaiellaceae bacterium]